MLFWTLDRSRHLQRQRANTTRMILVPVYRRRGQTLVEAGLGGLPFDGSRSLMLGVGQIHTPPGYNQSQEALTGRATPLQ